MMSHTNTEQVLRLEVPLVVVLGERRMAVNEVLSLAPGAIIELPKSADEELQLVIAEKPVGCGRAVKVGENFGIQLSFVGDPRSRLVAALASASSEDADDAVA